MAKKSTKAAAILELLNKGMSGAAICRRIKVSPGYVSALKKQMAHKVEETSVAEDLDKFISRERQVDANEVDTVLDAREAQYGSFMQSSDTAVKIKGAIHTALIRSNPDMLPDQMIALDMIAVKISRIVNGNAAHRDSWLDIAGYAKLVADRLGGKPR